MCQSTTVGVVHNTALNVPLPCSDVNGDPIRFEKVAGTGPSAGFLGEIDQGAARVFYSPFLGFTGGDSFGFRGVTDNRGGVASAPATISLPSARRRRSAGRNPAGSRC